VVAVAVVAQALWGMGKSLCPDRARASIAVAAAVFVGALPGAWAQVAVIVIGGLLGRLLPAPAAQADAQPLHVPLSRRAGAMLLALFALLLGLLPALAWHSGSYVLHLVDAFYRAGALVFGGGHVVLPLLQAEVVPTGWVGGEQFLAGYGAAQAVPGPLFTFAAYLGAVSSQAPNGWLGGTIALLSIFLPAFLLVLGALPLWEGLRRHGAMRRAMQGVNAAVVGLLLAAFYNPVWTSAIFTPADFMLAASAFLLLVMWKLPPWAVVLLCALAAQMGWR
jgi:chromate transporter